MNSEELKVLKSELLCYGLCVDNECGKALIKSRPYFYDKGFVHAVNTNICGSNVCVSVAERFNKKSPCSLILENGLFFVINDNTRVPIKLFDDLPRTNTVIDEIARPHSENCISLWPSLVCCYDKEGSKCKFCSIKTTESQTIVPTNEVISGLKALFDKTKKYAINIGGGTYMNPNIMADYLIEIAQGIRKFTDNAISAELAPPSDLTYIKRLYESGINSLIMNLEVADVSLRKKLCPGKSDIAYEHYYDCFREGVKCFGRGKISCVLIVGIQPTEDIIRECEKLTEIGVIPTLIPFKPMDDCQMSNEEPCKPQDLLIVSDALGKMLKNRGLNPFEQGGCTKCGGCSLETNYC